MAVLRQRYCPGKKRWGREPIHGSRQPGHDVYWLDRGICGESLGERGNGHDAATSSQSVSGSTLAHFLLSQLRQLCVEPMTQRTLRTQRIDQIFGLVENLIA